MITNTIHLSDCVKGMSALPKGSVDVVVTSPPYNLGIKYIGFDVDSDYIAFANRIINAND